MVWLRTHDTSIVKEIAQLNIRPNDSSDSIHTDINITWNCMDSMKFTYSLSFLNAEGKYTTKRWLYAVSYCGEYEPCLLKKSSIPIPSWVYLAQAKIRPKDVLSFDRRNRFIEPKK